MAFSATARARNRPIAQRLRQARRRPARVSDRNRDLAGRRLAAMRSRHRQRRRDHAWGQSASAARSARARLDGEYVVCPWHHWNFHRRTGDGEPGYEADRVPSYRVEVETAASVVDLAPATKRGRLPHKPHPLSREPVGARRGRCASLGISTTAMDAAQSALLDLRSLLEVGARARRARSAPRRSCMRLRDLKFRNCEGYYSKSARACTWPCSITQMDPTDQLERGVRGGRALGRRRSWSPRRSAGARRARSTTRWSSA